MNFRRAISNRGNLLIFALVAAMIASQFLPSYGRWLEAHYLIPIDIVTVFLCQGALCASINPAGALRLAGWGWAILISQLLAPLLVLLVVHAVPTADDFLVGLLIISTVGPTLTSGIIIATQAGGEVLVALLLTLGLNLLSVFVIPWSLSLLLSSQVEVPSLKLLIELVFFVLLPFLCGHAIRRAYPVLAQSRVYFEIIPIIALALLVFVAFSTQSERLHEVPWSAVILLAVQSLAVQSMLLFAGYRGARYLIALPRHEAISLTIVSAHKTLPVSLALWATNFAQSFPRAAVAMLIFHFCQVYLSVVVARRIGI